MLDIEEEFKVKDLFEKINEKIEEKTKRSQWSLGVTKYALELSKELEENILSGYFKTKNLNSNKQTEKQLLNGANNWKQYSKDGNSLIYNQDIARRLCNDTELKKTQNGKRRPNKQENWLDCQARALHEAANRVQESIKETLATTEKI